MDIHPRIDHSASKTGNAGAWLMYYKEVIGWKKMLKNEHNINLPPLALEFEQKLKPTPNIFFNECMCWDGTE